ncbi:MAG: VWA domain-containing protein [Spirochaetes bacterium]|uniref:VWA domain-containing protein n=1 Tax=Candidatus Avitreponema avistercoris TaxID=2840705 RepID=A0A9D9HGR7_9SPIR|nr:VWA domain-containing protein [Candidatus Avitreponema avistercoris]
MPLTFEHPRVLILLAAVLPAAFLFRYRMQKCRASGLFRFFRTEEEIRLFLRGRNRRALFFLFAWIFAVFGAAGPFIGRRSGFTRKSGSEVVSVFDVSRSMLVTDVLPSRLSQAALFAENLLDGLSGVPCAAVLVKGAGVLAVPLTSDHPAVYALLAALSPNLVSAPGSGLADGLAAAAGAFSKNRDSARFLVLLSDGGETEGGLIPAAARLRDSGISLIAVGVGTDEGAELDIYPGPERNERMLMQLNAAGLQKAAAAAGGQSFFLRAADSGAVNRVLSCLTAGESGTVLSGGWYPVNRRSECFLLALFCFSCAITAGSRRRKSGA